MMQRERSSMSGPAAGKDTSSHAAPEGTRAVIRAFQVLECLCEHGKSLRITEMAKKTGLNKATVFRMLQTLASMGYAEQEPDSDKYRATMKILAVSHKVLDRFELRGAADSYLQELALQSGQSVHLSVPDADSTVIIEKVEARTFFRVAFHVGRRSKMYSTGTGKAFLAFMSETDLQRFMDTVPLESFTPYTLCNRHRLLEELELIRSRGYAVDRQENTLGVSCVAVPIYDFTGRVLAAVSVTGMSAEIEPKVEELAPLVCETARRISKSFGN